MSMNYSEAVIHRCKEDLFASGGQAIVLSTKHDSERIDERTMSVSDHQSICLGVSHAFPPPRPLPPVWWMADDQ